MNGRLYVDELMGGFGELSENVETIETLKKINSFL